MKQNSIDIDKWTGLMELENEVSVELLEKVDSLCDTTKCCATGTC
jgi:hypothetical protein